MNIRTQADILERITCHPSKEYASMHRPVKNTLVINLGYWECLDGVAECVDVDSATGKADYWWNTRWVEWLDDAG